GRQTLVADWFPSEEVIIASFDRDGNFLEMQRRQFAGREHVPGFEPGLIRVKEFAGPENLSVYLFPLYYLGVLDNPDSPAPSVDEEFRQIVGSYIHRWLRNGDFVLDWTNDFWAGPDGEIHSS